MAVNNFSRACFFLMVFFFLGLTAPSLNLTPPPIRTPWLAAHRTSFDQPREQRGGDLPQRPQLGQLFFYGNRRGMPLLDIY